MQITKAQFVTSAAKLSQCPPPDRLEYAFIGRSNVGKSSLINMLTGQSKLAKTSATPGKTQLINHFLINDEWYLVDLPGYGYARVSKGRREEFGSMIRNYILNRESLVCLFMLVDSRHEPLKADLRFLEWLGEHGVPFAMLFTKADKLNAVERATCIERYHEVMKEWWESMPPSFLTSAETFLGKDEVLGYIDQLNKTVEL